MRARSHVVRSAVIPLDPPKSGLVRIIVTGSTQAMSYISVSRPPGLRMRRRNPSDQRRMGDYTPVILGRGRTVRICSRYSLGLPIHLLSQLQPEVRSHASPFFVDKIVRRRTATTGGRQRAARVVDPWRPRRGRSGPTWRPPGLDVGRRSSRRSKRSRPSSGHPTTDDTAAHRRRPARRPTAR